jgi:hypothetical protein
MANQITVNSGTGNITVTTSRAVIGTVANVPSANYANFAGNVVNAAQPNITSLGNLTTLDVTGTTTTGNLVVLGNLQVGNLVANTANFANFAGQAFNVSGANVTGAVANATFATTAGSANTANSATVANSANAVAGANVSGVVANATFATTAGTANSATVANSANSVTLANVSGAGNIASINLDGNVANVLKGNGTFGPEGSTGNANYANFAGTAFSVDGSNVSGTVANATFATSAGSANTANSATVANSANAVAGANVSGTVANATYALDAGNANFANSATVANSANAVAGANVSGTVANATYALDAGNANFANSATVASSANSVTLANVSGAGNIASINLDGSSSNVLRGDGTFAPEGSSGNANYANFAGNAFSVDGGNVSGAVANATFALDAGNANIANIAYSVSGANVSGTVANATFALDAGNANIANIAYSVSGANVSGTVANATFALDAGNANIANIAYSVAGANVSGTVANATFALDAGNANIANIAYSVAAANVSGLGNIATINLDGNASNVLFGNGTFGPEGSTGNANYANFAGNAFSVDGANVSGAVANATFALDAGNANIANIAYSVSGANVSGTVANATFALDAGNANIANIAYSVSGANVSGAVANATFALDAGNANVANIAYSVAAANVSGLGNIATINLDGNISNLLTGNGTFVAIPTSVANANYANFAGTVLTNAQPNITSLGNLTSLTVNNGSSSNTSVFEPIGATVNSNTYISVDQRDIANNIRDGIILANASADKRYTVDYLASTGNTIVSSSAMEVDIAGNIGVGNVAVPGVIAFNTYNSGSNLTTGDGNLKTAFSVSDGVTFLNGAPFAGNTALISTFNYGMSSDSASSTLWRSTRRRGNGTTRLSLEPNDYLGNIEWRGSRGGGSLPTGSRYAKIAPRVDSSYVANTNTQPVGIEFWVTDNTTARSQVFHANGNVTFSNAVNANTLSANYLYGDGSNITGIPAAGSNTQIQFNNSNALGASSDFTFNSSTKTMGVSGDGTPGSGMRLLNGGFTATLDNVNANTGISPFFFQTYDASNNYIPPQRFFRSRGNISSPAAVTSGDSVATQNYAVYADSGNTYYNLFDVGVSVISNDNAGNVVASYNITPSSSDSTINLNGNVVIGANGRLAYLRTFGSFTSNATQTSNGANTTNYMTLNNTEDANGISIASSTQITVARTGRYNIQFSAQLEKTDSGSDIIEIWLDKNGTAVANTATQVLLAGNNAKSVAAWDFNVNAANVNDYFRLAWASPDTDVQITAVPAANTISGVAIPSLIVDINPIGA